jgi:hypothetical protein
VNVADWQPAADALVIFAAPVSVTGVATFPGGIVTLNELGAVNTMPVLFAHVPVPPEPEIVPFCVALTTRTAKLFGFETLNVTSWVVPSGATWSVIVPLALTAVIVPVVPVPVPEPVAE